MAHISPNNIITINRGDTFIYSFLINVGTELNPIPYDLVGQDKLYLGVCEPNIPFEYAIIKKVFTSSDTNSDGTVIIEFTPTDTLNLLPGDYYYSIKLSQPLDQLGLNEKVTTLVPRTKFTIIE